uniref:Glycerol-3-phosphate acyltransferase 1 n=1 Tax=Hemiscolopendra marginata TaxID=943146 RepID=A0A646QEZ4_9MYRI
MVDLIQSLQDVYAKWEGKSQHHVKLMSIGSMGQKDSVSTIEGRFKNGLNNSCHPWIRRSTSHRSTSHPIKLPLLDLPKTTFIGDFKNKPTEYPSMVGKRPYMGACCSKCLPYSRVSLVDEVVQNLGFSNILLVSTMNEDCNFIVRKYHYVSHVYRCKMNSKYPDVTNKVLQDERVQDAVERTVITDIEEKKYPSDLYSLLLKQHTRRTQNILKNMKAIISSIITRLTAWVVFKFLSRLLISVQVNRGHIEVLKRASQTSLPLIFLPLHRSHLDYILVSFVLFNNEINMPLIAAGDNLRMPIIGNILKRLGGFFIKRKLDPKEGKKDFVYRAVLHSYMENCLKAGCNMEFFIEGGRSRTGKTCTPKAGLMAVLVDAYLSGAINDAYLVPVTISYEKLMDGNFVSEQMGNPKVMENLWSTIRAIWRAANSTYGTARVDFAQPFSLKEFLQSAQTQCKIGIKSLPSCNPISHNPGRMQLRRLSSSLSLYNSDISEDAHRQLVSYLAEHLSYDATHCTAIMSTNMVALLLLNKFRNGVTFAKLVQTMEWLKDELYLHGRDVGFSGQMVDIVTHAVDLLGCNLIEQTPEAIRTLSDEDKQKAILKPVISLPNVVELSYYSNVATSVFVLESVIATAVLVTVKEDLEALRNCNSNIKISRQILQETACRLCNIMKFEYIFVPPCSDLNLILADTVDRFIAIEILLTSQLFTNIGDGKDVSYLHKHSRHDEWSPESDEEDASYDEMLTVSLSESSLEHLAFYRSILSPLIETYWLVACSLNCLVDAPLEESEFLRQIRLNIQSKMAQGLIVYEESISADAIRNALKLFENLQVVETCIQDSIRLLYLTDMYNSENKLSLILDSIEEFRK